jgi:hypothetical protein
MKLLFLSVLLPIVGLAIAIIWLGGRQRQHLAQRETQWRADAAERGWTFDRLTEGAFELMRWQGTTDGVTWTLEYRRGRHRSSGTSERAHRMRWTSKVFQGPSSPVLCIAMKKGQEQPALQLAQGDGTLATLARKVAGAALDKTLDVYFGQEAGQQIDARRLVPLPNVAQTGYFVMAEDLASASHWLQGGPGAQMDKEANAPGSALFADEGRPWVLWVGTQVMLANMRPVRDTHEVALLVNAGVSLTKA